MAARTNPAVCGSAKASCGRVAVRPGPDVPGWARVGEAGAAKHTGPVHLPDIDGPLSLCHRDLGITIMVEIAGRLDVPAWTGVGETAAADLVGPVQLPNRDSAAVVLSDDVGIAVAEEIADAPWRARSGHDCRRPAAPRGWPSHGCRHTACQYGPRLVVTLPHCRKLLLPSSA
jgi:hypothetical protein